MKRPAIVTAILFCAAATALNVPKFASAATKLHLHPGETVYAADNRSVGYALCEAPEGAQPWQGTFPKPKLDAHGIPKTLFSYRAGDPLKVVSMHTYTWTYDGNHLSEKLWTMETAGHNRFCLRDAQVDDAVVATSHRK